MILLCGAGFIYFGAEALKMRRDSHKKLADARKLLEDEQKKNRDFKFGTGQSDGYIFLVDEVTRLRQFRGTRAWPNCLPQMPVVVNGTTVTLQLQVDAPSFTSQQGDDSAMADDQDTVTAQDTAVASQVASSNVPIPETLPQSRILPDTIVYLFDKRPIADGGCLLGEFTIVKVDQNLATLINVYPMTVEEIRRIDASVAAVAPWAVYTVLPREVPQTVLAGDGEPVPVVGMGTTEPDDTSSEESENILAQTPFQPTTNGLSDPTEDPRPALAQTFASLNHRRIQLLNMIEMQTMQKTSLETTQTEAMKMIEFYRQENDDTEAQHQETRRQYAEINKLYDATTTEISNLEKLIASLKSLNKQMLSALTQAQLRASEIILERNASLSMNHATIP
ncbi:MAG: hypothetical protein FWD31_04520 [Planctomycetaceae bacterium]|nr:hypothetical protein [Planctomycetaceae bacterium]